MGEFPPQPANAKKEYLVFFFLIFTILYFETKVQI